VSGEGEYQRMHDWSPDDDWSHEEDLPRPLRERAGYWRTRDGRVLKIGHMTSDHLKNAIHLFECYGYGDQAKIHELRKELAKR
jgi:hypothetical protein